MKIDKEKTKKSDESYMMRLTEKTREKHPIKIRRIATAARRRRGRGI